MAKKNPIVVGTDFSKESVLALKRASMLAAQMKSPLVVAHVVKDAAQALGRALPETWAHGATAELPTSARTIKKKIGVDADDQPADPRRAAGLLKNHLAEADVRAKTKVRVGSPHEEVLAVAEEEDAAIIVTGVHKPKSVMESFFLGSTAERILRAGHRPVLLARRRLSRPYMRILVPVDLGDQSLRLVTWVRDQFPLATLRLVHFVERPVGTTTAERHRRIAQARAHLDALTEAARLDGDRWVSDILEREPREGILAASRDWKADLIVMGSHRHNGVSRLLLGTTAEYVLRAALVDVLAMPPLEG